MEKDIEQASSTSKVKFSDGTISKLFDFLQEKTGNYSLMPVSKGTMFYSSYGKQTKEEYMRELKQRGILASTDVNAKAELNAGDSYDKLSDEARSKKAVKDAEDFVKKANAALDSSDDPMFQSLKVELKNAKPRIVFSHKDSGDDGWDTYLSEVWLKVSWKK